MTPRQLTEENSCHDKTGYQIKEFLCNETFRSQTISPWIELKMGIPVVDFGKFLKGTSEERRQVASEIDSAFRNMGFVYLQNHSVPAAEVENCFEWVGKIL